MADKGSPFTLLDAMPLAMAAVGVVGTWLLAAWKLKRVGLTEATAAEVADRAAFRKDMMAALAECRRQCEECHEQHAEAQVKIAELTGEIAILKARLPG